MEYVVMVVCVALIAWAISLQISKNKRRQALAAGEQVQQCDAIDAAAQDAHALRASAFHEGRFDDESLAFVGALRDIHARIRVGLSFAECQTAVGDLLSRVLKIEASNGAASPSAFARLCRQAVRYHEGGVAAWAEMDRAAASHNPGSWVGGGVGLEGALKGALMASALNSFTNNTERVQNNMAGASGARVVAWQSASECLTQLEELARYAAQQKRICVNCRRELGRLEQSQQWNGHIVCSSCRRLLETENAAQ